MTRSHWLLLLGLFLPASAFGQVVWTPVQGEEVERWRIRQALGLEATDGYLLRAPSLASGLSEATGHALEIRVLPSEAVSVWNSGLPRSFNDGALWAGRGMNLLLRGGVATAWGPIRLIVAPEVTYSENRPFQVFSYAHEDRSPFASPWHLGGHSLDLPLRFGVDDILTVTPGQSSLQIVRGNAAIGFATENLWWGPGIRNALVLSNHAPGFPHVFVRTRTPVESSWGRFEGAWIAGTLTESLYFDRVSDNDHRSLAGLSIVYHPATEEELAFGLARVVVRPLDDAIRSPLRLPDAVVRWNSGPEEGGESGSDQVTSVFVRWLPEESGLDLFAEWAWTRVPSSLTDLLTKVQDTRGYTLGMQWTRTLSRGERWLTLQLEATNLERALSRRDGKLPADFYTGTATGQGFTHRGQLLGAGIGPGAQSQWLAIDLTDSERSVGLTFSRIRWEDDTLFRLQNANFWRHDVSLAAGIRGSWIMAGFHLRAEAILGKRYNYLFQNGFSNPGGIRTVDVPNHTLTLRVVRR